MYIELLVAILDANNRTIVHLNYSEKGSLRRSQKIFQSENQWYKNIDVSYAQVTH